MIRAAVDLRIHLALTMADDNVTTTTVTFRLNHLVRLRGFNHVAFDGQLCRIESKVDEATGKFSISTTAFARPHRLFQHEVCWSRQSACITLASTASRWRPTEANCTCVGDARRRGTATWSASARTGNGTRTRTAFISVTFAAAVPLCSRLAFLGTSRRCVVWWRRKGWT